MNKKLNVSIVIPTRDRLYILKEVIKSYYEQQYVSEIVLIDDASDCDLKGLVEVMQSRYPTILTKEYRNRDRMGALYSKKIGLEHSTSDFILFGEDDVELGPDYVKKLVDKINYDPTVAIVSGQIIYMMKNENKIDAYRRFREVVGDEHDLFDKKLFGFNHQYYLQKEAGVLFTHSIHLIRKEIIKNIVFDTKYSVGNGYREETDHQMQIRRLGFKIIILNGAFCYHHYYHNVKKGGQRVNRISRVVWNTLLTNYFYKKHFNEVKQLTNINYSRTAAIIIFFYKQIELYFLIPIINRIKILFMKLL